MAKVNARIALAVLALALCGNLPRAVATGEAIDADPAVRAEVFVYGLHDFRVFYPGSVSAVRR